MGEAVRPADPRRTQQCPPATAGPEGRARRSAGLGPRVQAVAETPTPAELPAAALAELGEMPERVASALRSLQAAADVSFGCSEKDAVHREDKLTLYHYRPIA